MRKLEKRIAKCAEVKREATVSIILVLSEMDKDTHLVWVSIRKYKVELISYI